MTKSCPVKRPACQTGRTEARASLLHQGFKRKREGVLSQVQH